MTGNWGHPAAVFGHDAKIHPVTKRHIENGHGALPEQVQIKHHLADIEREQGKHVADRMREEIKFLQELTTQQEPNS